MTRLATRSTLTLSLAVWGMVCAACASSFAADTPDNGATGATNAAVQSAVLETRADLVRDTQVLNDVRTAIDTERRPLAARLDMLQAHVAGLRGEAERLRRLRQQGEKEQAALVAEAKTTEETCRFILAVFSEYARAMETRVTAAEAADLSKQLSAIGLEETENENFAGMAAATDRLLYLASAWNEARLGGRRFDGAALDADGIEHEGRFALFGPVAYFADSKGSLAGLAITRFGTALPAIYNDIQPEAIARIRAVVAGEAADVPVDVTSGDAIKLAEARTGLVDHVKAGGFVMVPLVAVGLVALVLAAWKTVELATVRVSAGDDVRRAVAFAREGRLDEARQMTRAIQEPVASLVAEALTHRASPREHLEEILHERVLGILPRLERHLGTLAVLGGIAPLLGLLGTVTGMIHTFQLVTVFGSGDAKLLSGGISEALVTTEFGLAIAIPVLLAHAFLARRARGIVAGLERTAVSMVNEMHVKAPDE